MTNDRENKRIPVAGRAWYVCVTKPRQEIYAASKLAEQGYELYLPMLQSWIRRAGAWSRKQSVMFPRYAFVRLVEREQAIGPIRSTPGVTGLVSFGPKLACLSDDRLEALRSLVAARAACLPEQPLAPGARVVFATGPLAGMVGIVSSVAAERVWVMMSLLGREQAIAAKADHLACV
jgi:transcriptional antiterminator RfaH